MLVIGGPLNPALSIGANSNKCRDPRISENNDPTLRDTLLFKGTLFMPRMSSPAA